METRLVILGRTRDGEVDCIATIGVATKIGAINKREEEVKLAAIL